MEETRRRNNNQDVTNDAVADVTTNESDNPRENGVFFAGNKAHSCLYCYNALLGFGAFGRT